MVHLLQRLVSGLIGLGSDDIYGSASEFVRVAIGWDNAKTYNKLILDSQINEVDRDEQLVGGHGRLERLDNMHDSLATN